MTKCNQVAPFVALIFLLTVPVKSLFAVGLGPIVSKSALNQPFNADVPIYGVDNLNPEDFHVTLASVATNDIETSIEDSELYKRKIKFDIKLTGDGKGLIHMSTHYSVREPYLHFKLSVETPKNQAIREYMILLDPPVIDP